ncbi:MAG: VWA domain-containing protein [Pyrinomonadaceae bacterium]
MKKPAALLLPLALCALALSPVATSAQSRARRVGTQTTQSAPQQPTQTSDQGTSAAAGDAAATRTPRQPPTLGGAVMTGDQQPSTGARAPQSNEPVEVDESEVVNVNTTLVTLPVSVMDRAGKYIPDLRKEDFLVYEDGVEQQVAYFATTEKPFTVALVIDTSGSTRYRIEEMQDAAISFVDQLRADDRVMVVSFDDEVRVLSEPTNDHYALRNAIRRARRGEGTRLYDAVDFVINQKLNRIEGRKAIVLFTDGVDTSSHHGTYQTTVRDAEEADALIYPVQYDTFDASAAGGGFPGGGGYPGRRRGGGGGGYPGGGGGYPGGRRGGSGSSGGTIADILGSILGGGGVTIGRGGGGRGGGWPGGGTNCSGCTAEEYERGDQYLGDLANMSGARRYRADDNRDLSSTFALVAEELRRQYSLGYYPKRTPTVGERRHVKVRVTRPELAVQTRDTYVFGAQNQNSTTAQKGNPQTRPSIKSQPFNATAPRLHH